MIKKRMFVVGDGNQAIRRFTHISDENKIRALPFIGFGILALKDNKTPHEVIVEWAWPKYHIVMKYERDFYPDITEHMKKLVRRDSDYNLNYFIRKRTYR